MSLYQDHEGMHRREPAPLEHEHPSDEKRRLAARNGEHLPPRGDFARTCYRCADDPEGGCRDCG